MVVPHCVECDANPDNIILLECPCCDGSRMECETCSGSVHLVEEDQEA